MFRLQTYTTLKLTPPLLSRPDTAQGRQRLSDTKFTVVSQPRHCHQKPLLVPSIPLHPFPNPRIITTCCLTYISSSIITHSGRSRERVPGASFLVSWHLGLKIFCENYIGKPDYTGREFISNFPGRERTRSRLSVPYLAICLNS